MMSKITQGYKVVDSQHKSAWVQGSGVSVQYKHDEWVYPTIKNSSLFAFKDVYSAKSFANIIEGTGYFVYRCDLENEHPQPRLVYNTLRSTRVQRLEGYWMGQLGYHYLGYGVSGACIADAIRITGESIDE